MAGNKITGHMIVKNEDRFVWYAIWAVLPYLDRLLIYDTGSGDKTVEVIKSISSPKIIFEEKGTVNTSGLVALRREQIKKTTTEFFMLIDGDEIWPENNLKIFLASIKNSSNDIFGFFCRTRNCVGDIYHYLPESAGKYHLKGLTGHYNIRAYRNHPRISVDGDYPLEYYTYNGKTINDLDNKLEFIDTWYLHTTHLQRSSLGKGSKYKTELGKRMLASELPKVFSLKPSDQVLKNRGSVFLAKALIQTPLKIIKRKINL